MGGDLANFKMQPIRVYGFYGCVAWLSWESLKLQLKSFVWTEAQCTGCFGAFSRHKFDLHKKQKRRDTGHGLNVHKSITCALSLHI